MLKNQENKIRIALFGSFYRGFYLLQELLHGDISKYITIVGVATDDPTQQFISREKRVWQYPHTLYEENMVQQLAQENHIHTFTGRIKTENFYNKLETQWMPQVCISATFGQLINERIFEYPALGFYNLHPSYDNAWPSYPGGNPFKAMLDDKKDYVVITIHKVDATFDTGELLAFSDRIYIPKETSVTDLHKITSPLAAKFATTQLLKLIEKSLQN